MNSRVLVIVLAAVVVLVAGAGAAVFLSKPADPSASPPAQPLTADEYKRCFNFKPAFGAMPSPVESALVDAYARSKPALDDAASALPTSESRRFYDEAHQKIISDPAIIAGCRAYVEWWRQRTSHAPGTPAGT